VESFNVGPNIPGSTTPAYLEFQSVCPNYITSNRPMMVAQFLSGACSGVGDPDMVYLSPLQQGINQASFYRNTTQSITANVLTLIGSSVDTPKLYDAGVPIPWTTSYVHPNYPTAPGGPKRVYIKHWPTAAAKQVTVNGDSTFTAITYGLGSVESYMYNAGTNIKTLFIEDVVCKQGDPSCLVNPDNFTCSKTPFQMSTGFLLVPDSVVWKVSNIVGIHPNVDFIQRRDPATGHYIPGPDPIIKVKPNGDSVYIFTLPNYYTIDQPGSYVLEVQWWNPDFEGCDKSRKDQKRIYVKPSPYVDFVYNPNPICPNTLVKFTPNTIDSATVLNVNQWQWTSSPYGINTTDTFPTFFYGNAGTDTVKLHFRIQNFCIGDTAHVLTINPSPVVNVVSDSIHLCATATANINIQSPLAGATYYVYTTAIGGTAIATGNGTTAFSFPNMTIDSSFYIECISSTGCVSVDRKKVKITVTQFPVATATPASTIACIGTAASFNVVSPVSGANYTWYDAATAGNTLATGNTLTINPVTADGSYYLETSINGCVSVTRFPVSVTAATPPSLAVVSNAVTVCSGDPASFAIASPDATVTYNWYTFSTGGTATTGSTYSINPATTTASYYVSATSVNGCTTSPRLKVDLNVTQRPVVIVTAPTDVTVCKGTTQTFTVQSPVSGTTYNWYDVATGGTAIATNTTTFTTPAVNATATYYVDGTSNGCTSITRATVKVSPLDKLTPPPVLTATRKFPDRIVFDWSLVPNAIGYQISVNGAAFKVPSSGSTGLQHIEFYTNPGDSANAVVKALGTAANGCQDTTSNIAYGITVINSTYYPNSFTPNGDGKNDKLVICGSSIKELRYAVFNQFGEKIWETTTATVDGKGCYTLWDGTQRGVPQPSGVYIYASRIVFLDGKVEEKNGSINLVR
jgi:gliding motility-associated-like protein